MPCAYVKWPSYNGIDTVSTTYQQRKDKLILEMKILTLQVLGPTFCGFFLLLFLVLLLYYVVVNKQFSRRSCEEHRSITLQMKEEVFLRHIFLILIWFRWVELKWPCFFVSYITLISMTISEALVGWSADFDCHCLTIFEWTKEGNLKSSSVRRFYGWEEYGGKLVEVDALIKR